MSLDFKNRDPAQSGFQFLEDLSSAYWYSKVLFTSLELELFSFLDQELCSVEELASSAGCNPEQMLRVLTGMERTGLVTNQDSNFYNTPAASLFKKMDLF